MYELAHRVDIIISAAGFSVSIMGILLARGSGYLEKKPRRFFIVFFTIISIYALLILLKSASYGCTGAEWAVLSRITLFGQALVSSILTVLMTVFLLYQSGEADWRRNGLFYCAAGLWLVYFAILICAQFTNIFYTVDNNSVYSRGPYFPFLMTAPVLIMLVNLIILIIRRKMMPSRQKTAFVVYITVPMLCMLVQSLLFGVQLIALGTVLSGLFMFNYFVNDQKIKYLRQEKENAQLKIDILLAQIQPHFLFNSLTAIKYLCRWDPVKAEGALSDFMIYLRHNVDSITTEIPILFLEGELDHVKAYLALQKYRFGDELQVEYDLECTDFRIPTMTVLPLVENAVSYGIRRNSDRTGTVRISTRRYPDRIEVCVADDGPGFVTDVLPADQTRSHIGIKNVRERLARVLGGELKIDSAIGKGTRATIILPEKVQAGR